MGLICLHSYDGLCAFVSNHRRTTVDEILSTTRIFSNLELCKLIHYWNGTTYHLTHRELIIVKHLSKFDDNLMDHDMLSIDEERPFLLLTKE